MEKEDKLKLIYDKPCYWIRELSEICAKIVLPFINILLHPNSVIDIGCGTGTWLKVFKELNCKVDIFGIDGAYVQKNLTIPTNYFKIVDLEQRIDISKKYDLAISLEVAEHLSEARAESFIKDLTNLSDVILFSAGTIDQEGDHHINCQYASYWNNIFKKNGYYVIDFIRGLIVNEDVAWWYKNNIFLYVASEKYNIIQQKVIEQHWAIAPIWAQNFINPNYFETKIMELKSVKEKNQKLKYRYEYMNKWLQVIFKYSGHPPYFETINQLIEKKVHNIAIYGYGVIGERFIESLPNNNNYTLTYIFDNNEKKINIKNLNIQIQSFNKFNRPEDLLHNIDIVVITTFFETDLIYKKLKYYQFPCISLEAIINQLIKQKN